jgi:PAS domain S-box-containing protein
MAVARNRRAQHPDQDPSAQLYRLIADTIPHIVWTAHPDGSLDFFNRRCYEYTGLDASALSGWAWKSVIHADDLERTVATWTRALQSGERFEIEYRLRRVDGAYRWHQAVAMPMRDGDGRVARWFGTCTDVELQMQSARILESERQRAERALRDNERRFELFMEHLPALAWIRDSSLNYTYVNRRYAAELGREPGEFIGETAGRFFPPEVARVFNQTDREVQARGAPLQFLDDFPSRHWLKIKFPLPDPAGGTAVGGFALDLTERVRLEEALAESESRARALVGRLIAARESERRQLADELHDLIGQNLTALGIDLIALKPQLQAAGDAAGTARLDAMRSLVEGTIESIRGVMTGLRPPALEEFGLVPALRAYTAEFSARTGIKTTLGVVGGETRCGQEIELALFRIVQEALINAAKHSGAATARVEVAALGPRMRVSVSDDGHGFSDERNAARGARGGWGVPEMRERVEAHGGTLRVETSSRGTHVTAEVPARAIAGDQTFLTDPALRLP